MIHNDDKLAFIKIARKCLKFVNSRECKLKFQMTLHRQMTIYES